MYTQRPMLECLCSSLKKKNNTNVGQLLNECTTHGTSTNRILFLNKIKPHATTMMNLKSIMLNEWSHISFT